MLRKKRQQKESLETLPFSRYIYVCSNSYSLSCWLNLGTVWYVFIFIVHFFTRLLLATCPCCCWLQSLLLELVSPSTPILSSYFLCLCHSISFCCFSPCGTSSFSQPVSLKEKWSFLIGKIGGVAFSSSLLHSLPFPRPSFLAVERSRAVQVARSRKPRSTES